MTVFACRTGILQYLRQEKEKREDGLRRKRRKDVLETSDSAGNAEKTFWRLPAARETLKRRQVWAGSGMEGLDAAATALKRVFKLYKVNHQSWKNANDNPVNSIKTE